MDTRPWVTGQIRTQPIGLHETVLRVRYMSMYDVRVASRAMPPSLLTAVCRWRMDTPDHWCTLIRLLAPKV